MKSPPEGAQQKLADALETMGKLLWLQREMGMYTALTAAATGWGADKSTKTSQRMERQKR